MISSFEATLIDSLFLGEAALNAVANGWLSFCLLAKYLINASCNSCSLMLSVSRPKSRMTSSAFSSETLAASL